jgi:mannose-6-phosphate isomerase-like protein (cupin superfamily)
MYEEIKNKKELLAIIIKSNYAAEQIKFFTPGNFSQQLGYMNRPKGYVIPPHRHNIVPREVIHTQEVLFIKSGKVRVDFYDDEENYLESRVLYKGDIILLASGGHGFEMIEPSEIIEVKQGPYVGEQDKVRFENIEPHKIKLGNNG